MELAVPVATELVPTRYTSMASYLLGLTRMAGHPVISKVDSTSYTMLDGTQYRTEVLSRWNSNAAQAAYGTSRQPFEDTLRILEVNSASAIGRCVMQHFKDYSDMPGTVSLWLPSASPEQDAKQYKELAPTLTVQPHTLHDGAPPVPLEAGVLVTGELEQFPAELRDSTLNTLYQACHTFRNSQTIQASLQQTNIAGLREISCHTTPWSAAWTGPIPEAAA